MGGPCRLQGSDVAEKLNIVPKVETWLSILQLLTSHTELSFMRSYTVYEIIFYIVQDFFKLWDLDDY